MNQTDLDNCDQEPIHRPGSIQPHGILLGVDEESFIIQVVSENVWDTFGLSPQDMLQRNLAELLDETGLSCVRDCLKTATNPLLCGPLTLRGGTRSEAQPLQAVIHRSSGLLIIELEPAAHCDAILFEDYHLRLRQTIASMRETDSIAEMCQRAVQEVKHLTAFDRVMLYRFDNDWNGQVIAEARESHLEPLLGLHYPASDIPAQARQLYTLNWLRLIVDRDYQPARLIPEVHPATGEPIDLSHSILRSVSPVHLQYLRNMGVQASMSVSLLQDGKLWGLIACHHSTVKPMSYDVRLACESLAQILSWQISSQERAEQNSLRAAAGDFMTDILTIAAQERTIPQGLLKRSADLLRLVNAQGVAIQYAHQLVTAGTTPSADEIKALIAWLQAHKQEDVFATHRLPRDNPAAAAYAKVASGVLAIHLLSSPDDWILWFRPERVETVNWAGNPEKVFDPESHRLSPRASFAVWQETVLGQSMPWNDWQKETAGRFLNLLVASIVKKAEEIDKLNLELQYASQAKDEFLAMVSHELRTPLNSMIGWMQMIRGNLLHESEYQEAYQTIERNAYDQLQLIEDLIDISRIVSGKMKIHPTLVEMNGVLHNAIHSVKPAMQMKDIRLIVLDAPSLMVHADADRLQQIFWNLLNNAVKFTPRQGLIEVGLSAEEANIRVYIQDNGQGIEPELLPYIFDRFRQGDNSMARKHLGLGLGLSICRHLIELHGGTIRATSEGRNLGSRFEIELPASTLLKGDLPSREKFPDSSKLECPPELLNKRILIVDDEGAARQVLSLVFNRLGLQVELASSAESALELLSNQDVDLIISDIGMPEMDGFQFVEKLRAQKPSDLTHIPAIALSAYTRGQDKTRAFRSGFQAHVSKPVDIKELLKVMAGLCSIR